MSLCVLFLINLRIKKIAVLRANALGEYRGFCKHNASLAAEATVDEVKKAINELRDINKLSLSEELIAIR
jgi:hypothetical protein